MRKLTIYTDGASRGNPGKSASAFYVHELNVTDGLSYPDLTNNQAEYSAIVFAMNTLAVGGYEGYQLDFHSDSQLVVNQLNGTWKTNDAALRVFRDIILNDTRFNTSFTWVPRDTPGIVKCDALCNKILDEYHAPCCIVVSGDLANVHQVFLQYFTIHHIKITGREALSASSFIHPCEHDDVNLFLPCLIPKMDRFHAISDVKSYIMGLSMGLFLNKGTVISIHYDKLGDYMEVVP